MNCSLVYFMKSKNTGPNYSCIFPVSSARFGNHTRKKIVFRIPAIKKLTSMQLRPGVEELKPGTAIRNLLIRLSSDMQLESNMWCCLFCDAVCF